MSWYQVIVDLVSKFWAAFVRGFTLVFKWLGEFYQLYTWAVWVFLGLLTFTFTYLVDVITWLGGALPQVLGGLGTVNQMGGGSQIPGPLAQAFSVANSFFPLTEAFGFVVAIGPIWMIAVVIRVVKSWLPTVN